MGVCSDRTIGMRITFVEYDCAPPLTRKGGAFRTHTQGLPQGSHNHLRFVSGRQEGDALRNEAKIAGVEPCGAPLLLHQFLQGVRLSDASAEPGRVIREQGLCGFEIPVSDTSREVLQPGMNATRVSHVL